MAQNLDFYLISALLKFTRKAPSNTNQVCIAVNRENSTFNYNQINSWFWQY